MEIFAFPGPAQVVSLLILGAFAGTAAGFFGIGGGIILGPVLFLYFEQQGVAPELVVQLTFGTNLLIIIFTSLAAVYKHNRGGNVLWRGTLWLGIFALVGAAAGSVIAVHTSGILLKRLYTLVLFYSSVKIFRQMKRDAEGQPVYNRRVLIPTGFAAGLFGALVGVGGGIIMIPVMSLLLHFPFKKIAGTSSSVIIFVGLSGMLGYMIQGQHVTGLPDGSIGYVNIPVALVVMMTSVLFAPVGAWLNQRSEVPLLKFLFALFLVSMGIKLLFWP